MTNKIGKDAEEREISNIHLTREYLESLFYNRTTYRASLSKLTDSFATISAAVGMPARHENPGC